MMTSSEQRRPREPEFLPRLVSLDGLSQLVEGEWLDLCVPEDFTDFCLSLEQASFEPNLRSCSDMRMLAYRNHYTFDSITSQAPSYSYG